MSEGWPEDKKRASSYSSDSNLVVNCRLSCMLLGNHGRIQEEKTEPDRCTAELLNRAVLLSALSCMQQNTEHKSPLLLAAIQYKRQVQTETWVLRPEQLLLPTVNSFFLSFIKSHIILILLFVRLLCFFYIFIALPPPTHFWAMCHHPSPGHHIC